MFCHLADRIPTVCLPALLSYLFCLAFCLIIFYVALPFSTSLDPLKSLIQNMLECSINRRNASIKQKAIELYFPIGKNKYGEEAQNCTTHIQDASGVLLNEDELLSTFLKERGVYTSQFYFVLHSYFEIFNSDLLKHDVCSICYYQMVAEKCAFCFPLVHETARSAGSYSSVTMVNSQQSNQN